MAFDGKCCAFKSIGESSCIAIVESDLKMVDAENVYAIFAYRSPTLSSWQRWVRKWSRRTFAGPIQNYNEPENHVIEPAFTPQPETRKETISMSKAKVKSEPVTVEMEHAKDCKGCVMFKSVDKEDIITNAYVSREMAGIESAKKIRVTVEVVE